MTSTEIEYYITCSLSDICEEFRKLSKEMDELKIKIAHAEALILTRSMLKNDEKEGKPDDKETVRESPESH